MAAKQNTGLIGRVRAFLGGKKTYLSAAIMIVLGGLLREGYIDENTYGLAYDTALALGLVALRAGVGKKK